MDLLEKHDGVRMHVRALKRNWEIYNGNWTEWSAIFRNHTRDFKIERARSASSTSNNKYDFRPKFHNPKFNFHFIASILKSDCKDNQWFQNGCNKGFNRKAAKHDEDIVREFIKQEMQVAGSLARLRYHVIVPRSQVSGSKLGKG